MHSLPVSYAGFALIVFAIILFILEIKIVSHGLLAIGGIISLLIGSMMLIKSTSNMELVRISRGVIYSTTLVTTLFFLFVIGFGVKAQSRKVVTGLEALIGGTAETTAQLTPTGTVIFQGETWNAESISGEISKGEKVRIREMKNLVLFVEKIQ